MKRRNLLVGVALFLCLGVVLVGNTTQQRPLSWKDVLPKPEYMNVDERRPLSEQTSTVILGGRTFEVPTMYIDSARRVDGIFRDSVLLRVIWPDMRSLHDLKDRQEYERIRKTEHRLGGILLESAVTKLPLDVRVANVRTGYTKEESAGIEDGLEKFYTYKGKVDNPTPWEVLYLERNEQGHITSRIACRRGMSARFPSCEHDFEDGGIAYHISYNEKAFFSQWREQRKRAIEFLRSFEIENDKQP